MATMTGITVFIDDSKDALEEKYIIARRSWTAKQIGTHSTKNGDKFFALHQPFATSTPLSGVA